MKKLITGIVVVAVVVIGGLTIVYAWNSSVRKFEGLYQEYNALAHGGRADANEVRAMVAWFQTLDDERRKKATARVRDDFDRMKREFAEWRCERKGRK